MVVYRWVAIVFFLLVVVNGAAAVDWGCCVPTIGECFNGDVFSSKSDFETACAFEGGSISGPGILSSCDAVIECTMGCCCPNDDVSNAGAIRNDEDRLWLTQISCQTQDAQDPQGSYQFRAIESSCVETCGGTVIPPPHGSHTVEGYVYDLDGAPVDGAEVEIPVPGGSISTFSEPDGFFRLEGVPEINGRIIVSRDGCYPTQSAPIFFDRDYLEINDEAVELVIQCGDSGCVREPPVIAEIGLVQGQKAVEITVEHNDICQDFIQFVPNRCDETGQNCNPLPYTVSPAILDDGTDLVEGETYCYIIRALFALGDAEDSASQCITLGSDECTDKPAGSWCGVADSGEAAILSCDESNILQEELCQNGEICSEAGGAPVCIPSPICEMCNGLLGLYAQLANLPPFFKIPIGDSDLGTTCAEAEINNLCYVDAKVEGRAVTIDGYSSCLGVGSCSDYARLDTCEANPCLVDDQCTWHEINEELGQGICRGNAQAAECDECDDIYGYCNRNLCESISPTECYFDELENNLVNTMGCVHRTDMACRYYDTEFDCNGGSEGQDAIFNVQYDSENVRSGSHIRTTSSKDIMRLGTCTWISEYSRCIKDADMQNNNEDDCIENDQFYFNPLCVQDDTPPLTTFFLVNPPIYGRHQARTLPYKVVDDMTAVDDINTYVCYAKASDPSCYPRDTLSTVDLPDNGNYKLYYYSEDLNSNLEPVKSVDIRFTDYGTTALESIDIVPEE
ncbi:carboxypeptidase regulatory-like domain-containing protein [Candidatus Woesearchaeota archaeon]|nr:carboxypeptidase regulatory-like domain-containing protein [Candidatus Woesearchaeota archaeon]